MKRIIGMALLASFFLFGTEQGANAQTAQKHKKHMKTAVTRTTRTTNSTVDVSGSDAAVTTQSTTDPLYLNHPYFNGEARWSHEDTLYKHGDFPWALVNKPGSGYTFNATTGKWEHSSTMGTAAPSR